MLWTTTIRPNHHNGTRDNHRNGEDLPHADVLYPFTGELCIRLAEELNNDAERAVANQEQAGDRPHRARFANKQVQDDEQHDAFQRQLKRFGIRVKGAGSDTVEKFFSTFESAVLFPEFLARAVRQGMDEANILPAITATVTRIDAMDYRSIYSVPEEADRSLAYVAEGASIPATAIRTREHLVRLYKRGRMLVASYEALRFQKLDLFSVMLRQIGAQIQAMHLEDAVNVLRNGDGNDNAAAVFTVGTSPISGEKGTLTYAQLVEFWAQFAPYEMNTMLVSNATMVRLLKLTELQNPLTGLNFQGTGKFETPLGASLLRTQAMADGCILAFDRRYALEMVQAGDVGVEYDKLIDRQLERAAITSISGFGKICTEAAKVLEV